MDRLEEKTRTHQVHTLGNARVPFMTLHRTPLLLAEEDKKNKEPPQQLLPASLPPVLSLFFSDCLIISPYLPLFLSLPKLQKHCSLKKKKKKSHAIMFTDYISWHWQRTPSTCMCTAAHIHCDTPMLYTVSFSSQYCHAIHLVQEHTECSGGGITGGLGPNHSLSAWR